MTYATTTDVQGLVPWFNVTTTSRPSLSQVAEYLDKCSGMINAALGSRGISTPVTSPASFVEDLESVEAMGAAGMLIAAVSPQERGPNGSGGSTYWKEFCDRLDGFRKGEGIPVGLSMYEQDVAPRSYFLDTGSIGQGVTATDDWGDTVTSDPTFQRDKVL